MLLFVISSCSGPSSDSKEKSQPIVVEVNVELNNGERWVANPETTEGIKNMIDHMAAFSSSQKTDSFKTLSDSLNAEFMTIFSKCTMKGEAHEQLHNYLFPMRAKFKALASDDLDICRSQFDELELYLATYDDYFE